MQRATQSLVVLGFFEVRKNIVKGPAHTAIGRPAVVILTLTTDVDHRIQRVSAAERACLHHGNRAVVGMGFRFCLVRNGTLRTHQPEVTAIHANEQVFVMGAFFKQQHAL
ncbi:hypothetical protein D3C81_2031120 [compost metagenome]